MGSITHISWIYAVEEEFDIEFAAEVMQDLANVDESAVVLRRFLLIT